MGIEDKLSSLREAIAYQEAVISILGTLNMEGEASHATAMLNELEHEYDYLLITEQPAIAEALDGPRFGNNQNF